MHKKSTVFLLLAWLMAVVGLLLGWILEPLWFARFGSLVVLFGVMSEYSLLHGEMDQLYRRLDAVRWNDDVPDMSPSKWQRKKVWVSHFTVIVGTLIWGFGDLLL
jgi:hypothetical protein